MNTSIIQKLKDLIDYKNYTQPNVTNEPDNDDIVSAERYTHDIDYFFQEGFKLGLMLGLECIGAKIKPEVEKQILAV